MAYGNSQPVFENSPDSLERNPNKGKKSVTNYNMKWTGQEELIWMLSQMSPKHKKALGISSLPTKIHQSDEVRKVNII